MMRGPYFGGMSGDALLLIALALGYIVCALANKENKGLKLIGYIIGIIVMVMSAGLIIGKIKSSLPGCSRAKYPMMNMPMMQQKMMREQAPAPAPAAAPEMNRKK